MKKTTVYRRPMDEKLFEEELTIEALSAMGNPLEQLSALVDFEMFRPELEDILVKKDCKSTAGRPQFDVVLMFKVIFLQRYYGLGDKQIQYHIIDRTSFRQFLGIHTVDEIPDEKTVWHVKNILSKAGTLDALFDKFRSIGIVRAKASTALTCLVYNIFRYVQINKYQPQLIASMG